MKNVQLKLEGFPGKETLRFETINDKAISLLKMIIAQKENKSKKIYNYITKN